MIEGGGFKNNETKNNDNTENDSRYADISYMAGIRDAVRMFTGLGLLKDFEELIVN